jgi:4-hydroxybenzoate polyprenyltransferase
MTAVDAAPRSGLMTWLVALRWHQWIKNALLPLPLLFSHRALDAAHGWQALSAVVVFCIAASAIYLINDVLDRESDAAHPTKCARPIAAGLITPGAALVMSVLLVLAALGISWRMSAEFFWVCVAYVLSTLAYSVWLKRVLLLDVLMLSGFYTFRLFAGSVATASPVSDWLLLFSAFFFLSLALQKRWCELNAAEGDAAISRRGYVRSDLSQLNQLGTSAGYVAVLVLALYITDPTVTEHYAQPRWLWWVCACVWFWLSRLWLKAGRGEVTEDAIAFAFRDQLSYGLGILVLGFAWLAKPV